MNQDIRQGIRHPVPATPDAGSGEAVVPGRAAQEPAPAPPGQGRPAAPVAQCRNCPGCAKAGARPLAPA